jgi:thymidylate synthase (FAD)
VKLIATSLEPEKIVAMASKLCYSASSIDELARGIDADDATRRVGNMIRWGHLSTLEHASFTFAISGISRACSHQLVRHRIASFSQQSQRYVKFGGGFPYVVPASVKKSGEALGVYRKTITDLACAYDNLIKLGIPAEDARYLLPNAAETRLIMTMNARSLFNFFELRLCLRAQSEIRVLAASMLRALLPTYSTIFRNVGPFCRVNGYCRQGEKTCPNYPKESEKSKESENHKGSRSRTESEKAKEPARRNRKS